MKDAKKRFHSYGARREGQGVTFALWAPDAKEILLGLFAPDEADPYETHVMVGGELTLLSVDRGALYGYKIDGGDWIVDPYARQLNQTHEWDAVQPRMLGHVDPKVAVDWEEDHRPKIPIENLFIYEMHVRGFTQDVSSEVSHPGTFLGVIEKIPYLESLGVTAVELMPIFTFDERANPFNNPITNRPLHNYWGYSPLHFFTPMARFASQNGNEIVEFKAMVKALHKAGIAVILDVVYNHTGEGCSLRECDENGYYLRSEGSDTNYSGCGNTLNCNSDPMKHLIVDSLTYWVEEMHVDGFRFDLASIFCRSQEGDVLEHPPVIDAIVNCPALQDTLLIAEPWDCAGLYQGGCFPGGGRFLEWNGEFRDSVRKFIRGDRGAEIQDREESISFVTAHDGFTLHDLTAYNEKHNEENGEANRDGSDLNFSWNCGAEGVTDDPEVLALRKRQRRNFLLALAFTKGVPMLLMGDEYGHTKGGNNNTYGHDSYKNYFLWDVDSKEDLEFLARVFEMRKERDLYHVQFNPTPNIIEVEGKKILDMAGNKEATLLPYSACVFAANPPNMLD